MAAFSCCWVAAGAVVAWVSRLWGASGLLWVAFALLLAALGLLWAALGLLRRVLGCVWVVRGCCCFASGLFGLVWGGLTWLSFRRNSMLWVALGCFGWSGLALFSTEFGALGCLGLGFGGSGSLFDGIRCFGLLWGVWPSFFTECKNNEPRTNPTATQQQPHTRRSSPRAAPERPRAAPEPPGAGQKQPRAGQKKSKTAPSCGENSGVNIGCL